MRSITHHAPGNGRPATVPLPSSDVKLPRTLRLPMTASRRGAITYIKLLKTVNPDRSFGGYAFEGDLLQPGQAIDEQDLQPSPDYPETPLLLECAGGDGSGSGHRRSQQIYILWRYEGGAGNWEEVARTASANRDWTYDLGPIARREIYAKPVLVDSEAAAERVIEALQAELDPLERKAQRLVILALYDRVAARVVGW